MFLENVVIGHSLESALFAYYNQYYYIPSTNFQPLFFEKCENFFLFGTNKKKEIYNSIKTLMGFLSYNLDYPELKQIRVQDDIIKIFGDNLLAEYEFGKCYICETLNVVHENKIKKAKQDTYKVIDDFKISRIGKDVLSIDPMFSNDKLLSEIYFYNSKRIDGAKQVTDAATVSYMSREDIYNFDYSDTIAAFKLRSILASIGYFGLRENIKYKNGEYRYKKILLEHVRRYVIPVDNNTYKNSRNIKFINPTIEGFLDGYST